MDELLGPYGLDGGDADVLHRLVGDWQLLADLSFADLVLLVPAEGDEWFTVIAQMRPTTGPTSYQDDLVGTVVAATDRPQLAAALAEGRIVREGDPVWLGGVPVREEVLPVTSGDRVIAVVARDTNLAAARTPSRLEIAYLQSANDLAQMLSEGRWPYPGERASDEGSGPRVGDGLIRLDPAGLVTFASPNALSAYRRLGHPGDLAGHVAVRGDSAAWPTGCRPRSTSRSPCSPAAGCHAAATSRRPTRSSRCGRCRCGPAASTSVRSSSSGTSPRYAGGTASC